MATFKTNNFLSKLYNALSTDDFAEAIYWSRDGSQLVVANTGKLEAMVLPALFKHAKFASFGRQLNIYGFARVYPGRQFKDANGNIADDASVWAHPTLTRDSTVDEISDIKRRAPPKLFRTRRLADGTVVHTRAGPSVEARVMQLKEEKQKKNRQQSERSPQQATRNGFEPYPARRTGGPAESSSKGNMLPPLEVPDDWASPQSRPSYGQLGRVIGDDGFLTGEKAITPLTPRYDSASMEKALKDPAYDARLPRHWQGIESALGADTKPSNGSTPTESSTPPLSSSRERSHPQFFGGKPPVHPRVRIPGQDVASSPAESSLSSRTWSTPATPRSSKVGGPWSALESVTKDEDGMVVDFGVSDVRGQPASTPRMFQESSMRKLDPTADCGPVFGPYAPSAPPLRIGRPTPLIRDVSSSPPQSYQKSHPLYTRAPNLHDAPYAQSLRYAGGMRSPSPDKKEQDELTFKLPWTSSNNGEGPVRFLTKANGSIAYAGGENHSPEVHVDAGSDHSREEAMAV